MLKQWTFEDIILEYVIFIIKLKDKNLISVCSLYVTFGNFAIFKRSY